MQENKLKRMVRNVVYEFQNTFVEGRQILGAVLIANKAIDSMMKSGSSSVIYKLDIKKTYDHVN